jgi:competence protein ComEC
VRGVLAAIPSVALRYPIKKWAALASLVVSLGYLVVSGAPVPTQRAFIMNAIVLLAILVDREALSLRSIGWAALAVMVVQPEAVMGPSFQMSFAAVYGLIAGYEVMGPRMAEWRRRHHAWWCGPALYVFGILLTTQLAGTATAMYTIFHFNRYATYSLLGNLLAVPIVGMWVMPAALLALCLLPFGLDAWGWRLMGQGLVLVGHVAQGVSSLPGATLDLPEMPVTALVVFTLGGLWLCLWRRRWRLWGLVGMVVGLVLYAVHQPPDILVDGSGKLAALRGDDGVLRFSSGRSGKRARETWAKQSGQGDAVALWEDWPTGSLKCDALGCLYRTKGHVVALALRPEALLEDCANADIVVVREVVRAACPSARVFLDATALRERGTRAIWLRSDRIRVVSVADWQGDRPWSHHRPERKWSSPAESDNLSETTENSSPNTVNNGAANPPDEPGL